MGVLTPRRRRSRVGLLLFTAVVVALLCKPLPAQNAGGTASGSGSSDQASTAGSGGQATAQDNGAQASSAQGGNAQATAQPETSVYYSGGNAQATDQYGNAMATDQNGNAMATDQNGNAMAATPASMSADQIIAILQQQPDLLESVKNAAAQQTGVDPSTISDDALYTRIRQSPDLRAQITKDLNQLGYSTNAVPATTRTMNAIGAAGATQARRPLTIQPAPYVEPDQPQVIRQTSPYKDLPSLRDLYAQLTPVGGMLRRFGSDAFILGTGNANELPMDLPVGPDYVLGVGDNIAVNMWGGRSGRLSLTIDRQGQIALPEAGTITLDGLTIAQAQSAIQKVTQYAVSGGACRNLPGPTAHRSRVCGGRRAAARRL